MQKTSAQKPSLAHLAENWPSPLIARGEVKNFTGGILSEKYLANLDSRGLGPKGRIKIGRKIAYQIRPFLEWLSSRSEALDVDHEPTA